jgi:hypothetical protein
MLDRYGTDEQKAMIDADHRKSSPLATTDLITARRDGSGPGRAGDP